MSLSRQINENDRKENDYRLADCCFHCIHYYGAKYCGYYNLHDTEETCCCDKFENPEESEE